VIDETDAVHMNDTMMKFVQSFVRLIAADFAKTVFGLTVTINGNVMPTPQLLVWPTFRPATKLQFLKNLSLSRQRVLSKEIL